MFKNISVEKVRKITFIVCVLIGVEVCYRIMSFSDKFFSLETFLGAFIGLGLIAFLCMISELVIISKIEAISYVQSLLSKDEYRKVNLKLEDNKTIELIEFSVEESAISYYAKIKSYKEVEISIRKDEKEISNKIIDVIHFKRFFTD